MLAWWAGHGTEKGTEELYLLPFVSDRAVMKPQMPVEEGGQRHEEHPRRRCLPRSPRVSSLQSLIWPRDGEQPIQSQG